MTRKDYVLIAEVLNDAVNDCYSSGIEEDIIFIRRVVFNMATALHEDNPKFLFKRFYLACGVEPQEMDL